MAVKITGLNIVRDPHPNRGGSIVLSRFDCEVNGIALAQCSLVSTICKPLTIWTPRECGYRIFDKQVREEIVDAARNAFEAFGGEILDAASIAAEQAGIAAVEEALAA